MGGHTGGYCLVITLAYEPLDAAPALLRGSDEDAEKCWSSFLTSTYGLATGVFPGSGKWRYKRR